MKILKKVILVFILALLSFAYYTVSSTGFFRKIESKFDGSVFKEINVKGAEDITISQKDSFALISATDRSNFPSKGKDKGGIYFLDLKSNDLNPVLISNNFQGEFAPHGISIFSKDSSYQVMVINHTMEGHSIEVFELIAQSLTHKATLKDPSMIRPNDLVITEENKFYFTNDHGYVEGFPKFIEEYGGLAVSNVVYYDSKNYREVANGIAYANGINIDTNKNLLFVASPRKFLVKVYRVKSDKSLTFIENIPCKTGVDNIEFDEMGALWIGCHPNLLKFNAYAKGKKDLAPSEIIKIDYQGKADYSVEKVFIDDGEKMSASTVAAPFGDLILTGNLMDEKVLVLKRN